MVNGLPEFNEQDAGEFAVAEPVIEPLEAIDLLPHGVRDGAHAPAGYHLDIRGQEAHHALLPEAAPEGADRVRMGVGLLCSLSPLQHPMRSQRFGSVCLADGLAEHWTRQVKAPSTI